MQMHILWAQKSKSLPMQHFALYMQLLLEQNIRYVSFNMSVSPQSIKALRCFNFFPLLSFLSTFCLPLQQAHSRVGKLIYHKVVSSY